MSLTKLVTTTVVPQQVPNEDRVWSYPLDVEGAQVIDDGVVLISENDEMEAQSKEDDISYQ